MNMKINKGAYIAITGRFQSFPRDVGILLLNMLEYQYQPFVSEKTDVLIKGYFSVDLFDETKESKKLNLAKRKEILILTEMMFLEHVIHQLKNLSDSSKAELILLYHEEIFVLLNGLLQVDTNDMIKSLIIYLEKKITIV